MQPKPEPMRGKRACTTCHLRPILAKGECRRCYRYRQDFLRRRPGRLDQHVGETVLGLKSKTVLWYWVSEAGEAAGLKCSPHLLRHARHPLDPWKLPVGSRHDGLLAIR